LREPRDTGENKVPEWPSEVKDVAATIAQTLSFYQSRGGEDARPAARDEEANAVPNDLMSYVGEDKCQNCDGGDSHSIVGVKDSIRIRMGGHITAQP
jgi:hypothetical protein